MLSIKSIVKYVVFRRLFTTFPYVSYGQMDSRSVFYNNDCAHYIFESPTDKTTVLLQFGTEPSPESFQ